MKSYHNNPNVMNIKCSKCGKESNFLINYGYDGGIIETILCSKCADKEWGLE